MSIAPDIKVPAWSARANESRSRAVEMRFDSDSETNYLGTYYFESPKAFAAGQPRSYTRRIGDPHIRYSNTQFSIYFQDDVRLSKSWTMTPGVRYEVQTHVNDFDNVMPRFGITWAPEPGGRPIAPASASSATG